jgi:hypothetical protein
VADRDQWQYGVSPQLILNQIIFYGAALLIGLVAGALSHSAIIGASAAGIVALFVAASLRTGD